MYGHLPPLVLASQSPRRAQLLQALGVRFTVHPASIDEAGLASGYALSQQAEALALRKARAVQGALRGAPGECLVLGADTVVLHRGRRLDKPSSPAAAHAALRQLAGGWHEVVSGVALVQGDRVCSFSERTLVRFSPMSSEEIAHYVRAFQPFDKAGGYGVQEWIGLACVERIEGSYTNVMGLPTQALHRVLLGWGR